MSIKVNSKAQNTIRILQYLVFALSVLSIFNLFYSCSEESSRFLTNEAQPESPSPPKFQGRKQKAIPKEEEDGEPLFETIQVFRAKRDPKELSRLPWTAQVKQDEMVATLTNHQRGGYFVDLAANHAEMLSNTYGLERNLGWKGLCIEAAPEMWGELVRRQCQLVAAVVGQTRGEKVNFLVRPQKDGLSGIVHDNFDNQRASGDKNEKTYVRDYYTIPLVDILRHNRSPKVIDYLSLDIEGAEFYVMEKFPFDDYQFRIITIERPPKQLRSLLQANNYKFHAVIGGRNHGETLWFHKDHISGLNLENFAMEFALPEQILFEKDKR